MACRYSGILGGYLNAVTAKFVCLFLSSRPAFARRYLLCAISSLRVGGSVGKGIAWSPVANKTSFPGLPAPSVADITTTFPGSEVQSVAAIQVPCPAITQLWVGDSPTSQRRMGPQLPEGASPPCSCFEHHRRARALQCLSVPAASLVLSRAPPPHLHSCLLFRLDAFPVFVYVSCCRRCVCLFCAGC